MKERMSKSVKEPAKKEGRKRQTEEELNRYIKTL
jgi:hypothetical protein